MSVFPLRFEDYYEFGEPIVVTAPVGDPVVPYIFIEGSYVLDIPGYTQPAVNIEIGSVISISITEGFVFSGGAILPIISQVEFHGFTTNTIIGSAGADRIDAQVTGQFLQGDAVDIPGGNDILDGIGSDTLVGMGGNDTLEAGGGTSYLYGDAIPNSGDPGNIAPGDDFLRSEWDSTTYLYGGEGANTIDARSYLDVLDYSVWRADDGSSEYYEVDANLTALTVTVRRIDPTFGDVWVVAVDTLVRAFQGTIVGTDRADRLDIGRQAGRVDGGGGNDTITGRAAEWAFGGDGDDIMTMIAGSDNGAYGGEGHDTITVNGRFAIVFGDGGDDSIVGANTYDELTGGWGNDTIYGLGDADLIHGEAGADRLVGGLGSDTLYGGSESDTLFGAGGDDWMFGRSEDDVLRGGAGNDTLTGGTGSDVLNGDAGADTFFFESLADLGMGSLRDTIRDFVSGTDRIDLTEFQAVTLFVGSGPLTGSAGQVRVSNAGILQGDSDGDGIADWQLNIGTTVVGQSDFV